MSIKWPLQNLIQINTVVWAVAWLADNIFQITFPLHSGILQTNILMTIVILNILLPATKRFPYNTIFEKVKSCARYFRLYLIPRCLIDKTI